MRIGVDVGGTNTDAVLVDGDNIVATHKAPTSSNVIDGLVGAIQSVLDAGQISPSAVRCVMIGTTHFTNAFVERRGLQRVGMIRIGAPASVSIPPLVDWPDDFREAIGGMTAVVGGGYQFDGSENAPLDEQGVADAARRFRDAGIEAIAISCVFSPLNDAMEQSAARVVKSIIPTANITLSSKIGTLGILPRENAAAMNASLSQISKDVVGAFKSALSRLNLYCPFFVSQNDGTLMAASDVQAYPVLTFASGPTNSLRGAAYLSGQKNAIVADIGGTTTDLGVLINGFPRESAMTSDIGGVRTNFRMPDILAIGLGGGSIVDFSEEGAVAIGPKSVGYRLLTEAIGFGGNVLTTSDIATAAEYANIGDPALLSDLGSSRIKSAVSKIHQILGEGVDRMKSSREQVPLILVGGGSVLINDPIPGVSEVITPPHAAVANAVGASIAQVGGETDRVYSYDELGRDQALSEAKDLAHRSAIEAGAISETIEIIDIQEVPLAYVPGGAVRVRIKAAGGLSLDQLETAA